MTKKTSIARKADEQRLQALIEERAMRSAKRRIADEAVKDLQRKMAERDASGYYEKKDKQLDERYKKVTGEGTPK